MSSRSISIFWRLAFSLPLAFLLQSVSPSVFASDGSSDWGYDHVKPPARNQGSAGLFARPAKSDYHKERDTDHSGMSAKAASGDWGGVPPESKSESKTESKSETKTESKPATGTSATAKGVTPKAGAAKGAAATSTAKGTAAKGATAKSASAKGAAVSDSAKIACARELLELASKHKLSPDQAQDVNTLFAAPPQGDWQKIAAFWPEVKKIVVTDDCVAEDFGYLFRALLRLSCSAKTIPPNQIEVVKAILGPERVAVEGTPPLTEEATESYSDMACFLYERKNPGKTIDADDNRAVFASVIMGKFKEAPSDAAKRSMANFALTWGKFKVAWDLASEENRPQLLKELDTASGAAALQTALEKKIFGNGPWTKAL